MGGGHLQRTQSVFLKVIIFEVLGELAHDCGMHAVNKDSFEELLCKPSVKGSQRPAIINTAFQISGEIHQPVPKPDLYVLLITKYNLCCILFSKR